MASFCFWKWSWKACTLECISFIKFQKSGLARLQGIFLSYLYIKDKATYILGKWTLTQKNLDPPVFMSTWSNSAWERQGPAHMIIWFASLIHKFLFFLNPEVHLEMTFFLQSHSFYKKLFLVTKRCSVLQSTICYHTLSSSHSLYFMTNMTPVR